MNKRSGEVLTMVNGVENWIPKLDPKLSQALADQVLDPSKMLMNFGPANDIAIIERIDMEVIKLDNISISCEDFLLKDFGDRKFSTIIANPPWVKVGIQFIDKMVDLLEDGGRLICVMGYNQFTDLKGKPGSFYDLQQRGSFKYVANYKGMSERDLFDGRGDWCWFVWDNHSNNKEVTICNRLGNSFDICLSGGEYYVPQLENEDKYFDWAGVSFITVTPNKAAGDSFNRDVIFITKGKKSSRVEAFSKGEVKPSNGVCLDASLVSEEDVNSWIDAEDWLTLYASSKAGDKLRCPPFRVQDAK